MKQPKASAGSGDNSLRGKYNYECELKEYSLICMWFGNNGVLRRRRLGSHTARVPVRRTVRIDSVQIYCCPGVATVGYDDRTLQIVPTYLAMA